MIRNNADRHTERVGGRGRGGPGREEEGIEDEESSRGTEVE